MKNTLPKARTADLLEQEAADELLIYDLRVDKAYTLNRTSAIIYKACNRQTFEELKREFNFADELIYLALDELKKRNLLEDDYASPFAGINRREVIRRVGLASMVALPIIIGITAPQAANAASSLAANNQACTTPATPGSTECQSGNCVTASSDSGPVLRCCANASGTNATPGFPFFAADEAECMMAASTGTCCSGMATYNGICTCT